MHLVAARPVTVLVLASLGVACGSSDLQPIQGPSGPDASIEAASAGGGGPDASLAYEASASVDAATQPLTDAVAAPVEAGAAGCKRGVAANAAPGAPFSRTASSPGVAWWYNWSNQGSGQGAGIEFVPMLWGSQSLSATIPAGSKYLLGFNEPNFKSQADLTPTVAAADWPSVEARAASEGIPIVSPAVNYCGSSTDSSQCSDSNVTDPYTYLKDFFSACTGCKVDYVAVHWYNCDLPSLRAYIDGNTDAGGGLQGFVQFGKPIWLTEFSCDSTHSAADQKAYMQAAVPYLEGNPNVMRYSWFSAQNIPNALLANSDGSLTDLGSTYVGLPQSCP